jgi:enoyl-CoA hydratase/carnithine racemase
MMLQLADAWLEFRDDPALRVAILTGSGHARRSASAAISSC